MKKFLVIAIAAMYVSVTQAQEWVPITEFMDTISFVNPKDNTRKTIVFVFDEMPIMKLRIAAQRGNMNVCFSDVPGGNNYRVFEKKNYYEYVNGGKGFVENKIKDLALDNGWYVYEAEKPLYPLTVSSVSKNDVQVFLSSVELKLLREMKPFYSKRIKELIEEDDPTKSKCRIYGADYSSVGEQKGAFGRVEYEQMTAKYKYGKFDDLFGTHSRGLSLVKKNISKRIAYGLLQISRREGDLYDKFEWVDANVDAYAINKLANTLFAYSSGTSAVPSATSKSTALTVEDKIRQYEKANPRKLQNIKPRPETEPGWTLVKSNKFADQDIVCEHWQRGNEAIRIFKKSNGDFATFAENAMTLVPSEELSIAEYRRTLSSDKLSIIVYGGFKGEHLALGSKGSEHAQIVIEGSKNNYIFRVEFPNGVIVEGDAEEYGHDQGSKQINWYDFVKEDTKEDVRRTIDKLLSIYSGSINYSCAHTAYDKEGVKYNIVGPTDNKKQLHAIDIETGNTYRLAFNTSKNNYSYEEIAIENYPKMKLRGNRLYYVNEHDSIIAVEGNVVKYANGDYLKYEDDGLSGQLHRNGGIADIFTKESYIGARIKYPDGKIFQGYLGKLDENGEYYALTTHYYKKWLCDDALVPFKGSMEMPDGTVVQIVEGMTLAEKQATEAEKQRRKQEAERQQNAAQQKVVNYYKKKYGYYPGYDKYSVYDMFSVGHPIAAIIEYCRSEKWPVPELVGSWGSTKKYNFTYYDGLNRRQTIVVYTRNGVISSLHK